MDILKETIAQTNIVNIIDIIANSATCFDTTASTCLLNKMSMLCNEYKNNDLNADWIVNTGLARCYEYEFNLVLAISGKIPGNSLYFTIKAMLEEAFFNKVICDYIEPSILQNIPHKPKEYMEWLKATIRNHPSFSHKFYTAFLNKEAKMKDIQFYLAQESTLDPRFDDLLALIQIGMPNKIKLEIAENYWDEMGCGNLPAIHNIMFSKVLLSFKVTDEYIKSNLLLSSIISGNISSYLALYRQNCYQAIGYFGVTEYCVPNRFIHFIAGCERIGMSEDLEYHKLHVTIDAKHAHGWFTNAIVPIVQESHMFAKKIAEGVLLRLNSSLNYLNEISNVLQVA